MKTMTRLVFLFLAGCTTPASVGVGSSVTVPKDSATQCTRLCDSINLKLDAVVVMASNVGCVCRASDSGAAPTSATSSTTGGMAAIMIQQAAAAAAHQQQQSRQRQRQQPTYQPPRK